MSKDDKFPVEGEEVADVLEALCELGRDLGYTPIRFACVLSMASAVLNAQLGVKVDHRTIEQMRENGIDI